MDKNIDNDPLETQEWREALASVLEFEGPDLAHFLLDELFTEATATA
jgi:pyruvate dehydrogenase E1 component